MRNISVSGPERSSRSLESDNWQMTLAFEVLDNKFQIVNWDHTLLAFSVLLSPFEKSWPRFKPLAHPRGGKTQVDYIRENVRPRNRAMLPNGSISRFDATRDAAVLLELI